MSKLLLAFFAGAIALGSVAAMAADEDSPAYKMGMTSQRLHDLQLQGAQATNQPATTAAESKELKDAAAKARAAYAGMSPGDKAMYKKGMKAQREMDVLDQPLMGDFWSPNDPTYPRNSLAPRKMPPAEKAGATKPAAGDATEPTK